MKDLAKFSEKWHSSNVYSVKGALSNFSVQKKKISFFKKYIIKKGIVELGCGRGIALKELQKYTPIAVQGFDINEDFIKKLKNDGIMANIANLDKNIPVVKNSIDIVYTD